MKIQKERKMKGNQIVKHSMLSLMLIGSMCLGSVPIVPVSAKVVTGGGVSSRANLGGADADMTSGDSISVSGSSIHMHDNQTGSQTIEYKGKTFTISYDYNIEIPSPDNAREFDFGYFKDGVLVITDNITSDDNLHLDEIRAIVTTDNVTSIANLSLYLETIVDMHICANSLINFGNLFIKQVNTNYDYDTHYNIVECHLDNLETVGQGFLRLANIKCSLDLMNLKKTGDKFLSDATVFGNINLDSLEEIGRGGGFFMKATLYKDLVIPRLKSLSYSSFYEANLQKVSLPSVETTYWGHYIFYKSSMSSLSMSSLTFTDGSFCAYATIDSSVDLPSLRTADPSFFFNATIGSSVDLPSLRTASSSFFSNATVNGDLHLDNLSSVGNSAFKDIKKVGILSLPRLVEAGDQFLSSADVEDLRIQNLVTVGSKSFCGTKANTFFLPNLKIVGEDSFIDVVADELYAPVLTDHKGAIIEGSTLNKIILPSLLENGAIINIKNKSYSGTDKYKQLFISEDLSTLNTSEMQPEIILAKGGTNLTNYTGFNLYSMGYGDVLNSTQLKTIGNNLAVLGNISSDLEIPENVKLWVRSGSQAEQWCKDHNREYGDLDTVECDDLFDISNPVVSFGAIQFNKETGTNFTISTMGNRLFKASGFKVYLDNKELVVPIALDGLQDKETEGVVVDLPLNLFEGVGYGKHILKVVFNNLVNTTYQQEVEITKKVISIPSIPLNPANPITPDNGDEETSEIPETPDDLDGTNKPEKPSVPVEDKDIIKVPNINIRKLMGKNSKFKLKLFNTSKAKWVKWSSSDTSMATVSKNGVVKTKNKTGIVEVKCKAKMKNGYLYSFTIKIDIRAKIKHTKNYWNNDGKYDNFYMMLDKEIHTGVPVKITLSNLSKDAKVTYSTSNKGIAYVNKQGKIIGVKQGRCNIKVTIHQNKTVYVYYINAIVKNY